LKTSILAKIILLNLVCIFAFRSVAFAKETAANLDPSITYDQFVTQFLLKTAEGENYFYRVPLRKFQQPILKTLVLVYIFSELKSGRKLPEEFKADFSISTEKDVIDELNKAFKAAGRASISSFSHYGEVNSGNLRTLLVASQTISEFSSKLNIKNKILRETLVKGYGDLAHSLAHHWDQKGLKSDVDTPYLKAAFWGIEEMNSALKPSTVIDQMLSVFKKNKISWLNQNETGLSCSRFFQ
jgi:hypothetical protein